MRKSVLLMAVIAIFAIGIWRYNQPLPALKAELIPISTPVTTPADLQWPTEGQAAIGTAAYGVLDSKNVASSAPIASIAKAITALAVLETKPIDSNQDGQAITITDSDVQLYRDYLAKNGSVIPVKAGQQITEKQALLSMMLPSANNMADTTAKWAFGSVENYVVFANQYVKNLGMMNTTVADASGFSPKTVSTAKDLVLLGKAVLDNPVLSTLIQQKTAEFPGIEGQINNLNYLLGTDGFIGIKTGNTDQAKGCFLFASKRQINGESITVIGAILGDKTRDLAIEEARTLIKSADHGFEKIALVNKGQLVGRYKLPWGGSVNAVASSDLTALNWRGKKPEVLTTLNQLQVPATQGSKVGYIKSSNGKTVAITLEQEAPAPPRYWRLIRHSF